MTPSTNTSSPIANTLVLNPRRGVVKKQVTIPLRDDCIVEMPTPFVLLTANIVFGLKVSPVGCSKILTLSIELDPISQRSIPSCSRPVTESTITKSGAIV